MSDILFSIWSTMGKPGQAEKSHSYPSHLKLRLTWKKGAGGRKKLKTNIAMEKKASLLDKWKKIQSNSNLALNLATWNHLNYKLLFTLANFFSGASL